PGTGTPRTQATNQIHVYFNDDPLSNPSAGPVTTATNPTLSVVRPDFYRLFATGGTVETSDDEFFSPSFVEYRPTENLAILSFADTSGGPLPLDELPNLAKQPDGSVTFRLRIGGEGDIPMPPQPITIGGDEATDTFADANTDAMTFDPTAGVQSVMFDQAVIENENEYVPPWPGAYEAQGTREQRRDATLSGRIDTTVGINIFPYNFAEVYGLTPQQDVLENAITPTQKQRIREILDLYEQHLGVRFVETDDAGLQFVNGDIRGLQQTADTGAGEGTPYSLFRVNERDPSRGVLVFDAGESWYDLYGLSPDQRPSFFVEGLRGVGNVLGIGDLFELPDGVAAGGSSPDEPNSEIYSFDGDLSNGAPNDLREQIAGFPTLPSEADFLSQSDITIGQALHRPESSDVDFYQFSIADTAGDDGDLLGRVTIETYAQRLDNVSLLDTLLQLYRVDTDATTGDPIYTRIARNDDMFSDDSQIVMDLPAGDYIVGVSSTGNDQYNGKVDGSGTGGRTEGVYQLRITFDTSEGVAADNTIVDTAGTKLDGDADGVAGGNFNFWFRTTPVAPSSPDQARTIFVSKDNDGVDPGAGDPLDSRGSLTSPYRTISAAIAGSNSGDIIRLLPSAGLDGEVSDDPATAVDETDDNPAYELGTGGAGDLPLTDGETLEVPQGVTLMIDAGAILKLRNSKIVVGSESADDDRSLAAIQVLGTPEQNVIFTSYNDESIAIDTNSIDTTPLAGDWAGIELRNDVDNREGRSVWATEGIFLDTIQQADIRFGGGRIDLQGAALSPIHLNESRPLIVHNTITQSADSAISADPSSFREDNFNEPRYQRVASFTSDYDRVGPVIYGNQITDNTINGLFVRVLTPTAGVLETLSVPGRFDDTEIVHVISEELIIEG
ncbi:MAG: peptidase, partial [Planctomycetota bacterium]